MRRRFQANALSFLVAASLSVTACGDDDDAGAANGGSLGTGGTSFGQGGTNISGHGGEAGQGGSGGAAGGIPDGGGAGAGSGGVGNGGAAGEGGAHSVRAALDLCRGIELPTDAYYVAPGMCARVVATQQGRVRQLTFDAEGSLLGVTVEGVVTRYRDLNNDGMFAGADEVVPIAVTGGSNGSNVHLDRASGYLYAGTPTGVKRWPYSTSSNALGAGEDVVTGEPSTGNHVLHTVHVYDDWLYVHSGSALNASAPASPAYDTDRAVLKRFDLSTFTPGTPLQWTSGIVFVSGLRNMVGFTQNRSGRMYGVVNGIDYLLYQTQDVHLDNPGEDLVLLQANQSHGYPFCFTASHIVTDSVVANPGSQLAGATSDFANPHDNAWCALNSVPPATFMPAHSAPLDLTFFDDNLPSGGLPEVFRGGAFVTLHGSSYTTPSVGHQIVFVPFDSAGNPAKPIATLTSTTFPFTVVFGGGTATAPVPGIWSWQSGGYGESPVRPVGVAISPVDGALYVSSDNTWAGPPAGANQGSIYRLALKP